MKTECNRAIWLTVDEAQEMLLALDNSKVLKCLDGSQRRHIDSAISRLSQLIVNASRRKVELSMELVGHLLQSVAASQKWFNSMIDEFGRGE